MENSICNSSRNFAGCICRRFKIILANHLSKITLITFEELVFPDIEQEIVVFIGEKGQKRKALELLN